MVFFSKDEYFKVFLPTKNCELFYLSSWRSFKPGDTVIVPYGPEIVPGIVMWSEKYSWYERPVPLRKMNYIKKRAPSSIEWQYRKLAKGIKKYAPDPLAWIDELEMYDALFGD